MSRLIESIRLLDGMSNNLSYHQARMDASIQDLFNRQNSIDLKQYLETAHYPKTGLFKCRILYDATTIYSTEFISYAPKRVNSLKIIESNTIDYAYKYEARTSIDELYALRDKCEDIIIVKNGLVADSSYSNLVFFDGTDWITPSTPLLKGTMRQALLEAGVIQEGIITRKEISTFQRCRLINAMVGFNGPELSVSQIVF
jgi:4-amino-4-deoxychorismate lyase